MEPARLILGDCLDELPKLPADSVDTCITDPPYHLTAVSRNGSPRTNDPSTPFGRTRLGERGFMGQTWDGGDVAFRPQTWAAVRRVLKPGALLLAFGGPRTFHRVALAIEEAGFEVRDCLVWLYAVGFPKSHNFGRDLDGWGGWGTGLKPAWEPILVAMKPRDGTFRENAVRWAVAGFNIDGARIPSGSDHREKCESVVGLASNRNGGCYGEWKGERVSSWHRRGRWPANVLLDEGAARQLDRQSGRSRSRRGNPRSSAAPGEGWGMRHTGAEYEDDGGASRFFYCAKASRAERGIGGEFTAGSSRTAWEAGNHHPTVKPLRLLEYLCTLTSTPGGGVVLDPFLGSGTTAVAALRCGRACIGIEKEPEYLEIARRRVSRAIAGASAA